MGSDEWTSKSPCPVCGGPITCWYAFDDYGPSGGYYCERDHEHEVPYEVAYAEETGDRG